MNEMERLAVQRLRKDLVEDPRKPLSQSAWRGGSGSDEDHALFDILERAGFVLKEAVHG